MTGTYLSSHNPLSLLDEAAFGTLAVAVSTGLLVSSETGDQTVVPAAGAFWHPCSTTIHISRQLFSCEFQDEILFL